MNRISAVLTASVVIVAASWHLAPSAEPKAGQARWEYRVLKYEQLKKLAGEDKDLVAGLNKLGQEGWELAAAEGLSVEAQLQQTTDPNEAARLRALGTGMFIFKRAK